jgi:glycine/D-amino acid oxidase-like deaminating enzyme
MARWRAFDAEWGKDLRLNLYHTTGDLILRPDWEPYLARTKHWWDAHGVPYEQLDPADVRRAFPVIAMDDITAVLYEPDAGVVRARRSCQTVAAVAERMGARLVIGRARPGRVTNGRLDSVALDTGETLRAETFVFAPGPWLGKTFPELFTNKVRTPLGYVCYFGTPAGDERFTYPNLPSFNFPGVTGWPALPGCASVAVEPLAWLLVFIVDAVMRTHSPLVSVPSRDRADRSRRCQRSVPAPPRSRAR